MSVPGNWLVPVRRLQFCIVAGRKVPRGCTVDWTDSLLNLRIPPPTWSLFNRCHARKPLKLREKRSSWTKKTRESVKLWFPFIINSNRKFKINPLTYHYYSIIINEYPINIPRVTCISHDMMDQVPIHSNPMILPFLSLRVKKHVQFSTYPLVI